MKLTQWEAFKVVGEILNELGVKAEKFEDETGEEFKLGKADIVELVIDTVTKIGIEVLD